MTTTNTTHIASGPNADAYVPDQLRAGDGPFQTRKVVFKSGQTPEQYRVVAREASSGKFVNWDADSMDAGTAKAIGITCYAVDASGGDVEAAIYVSGFFNTDALVWDSGANAAQKEAAFDGTAIHHRALV